MLPKTKNVSVNAAWAMKDMSEHKVGLTNGLLREIKEIDESVFQHFSLKNFCSEVSS